MNGINYGPDTVIRAENLVLSRGRETLIRDISWQVDKGQHWALLGVNGAGKTLLLKILTGYVWPTRGGVEILGQALGQVDLRTLRRRLGWVAKALEELTPPRTTVLEAILSGPGGLSGALCRTNRLPTAIRRSPGRGIWPGPPGQAGIRPSVIGGKTTGAPGPGGGGRSRDSVSGRTHNTMEIGPFMTHALFLKDGRVVARGRLEETMQPEILQATFDLPLKVERSPSGRYLAYI